MIRSIITLLPDNLSPTLRLHLALTVFSVMLRAAAALLLVPVVAALFSPIRPRLALDRSTHAGDRGGVATGLVDLAHRLPNGLRPPQLWTTHVG